MAVKTRFSEAELIGILSNYNLGEFKSCQPITAGTVQTNFAIQTTHAKVVFRYYENRTKESVAFECCLVNYLKTRKYPCPAPFKNIRGKFVGIYQEKPFVLFEFIEGQHLENPSPEQKKQFIHKVAELQILTRNYRPRNRSYRWNYSIELCRDLAQKSVQTLNTASAREKLAWLEGELRKLNLPRSMPKGICHCDFHFSNILFKEGEFAALIDFDDANYTYLTYDLITLINPFIPAFDWNTWPQFKESDPLLDFDQDRALVAEYMRTRPLNSLEKRHLFDVLKLSILFDCIWYFDRGAAHDFYEKRKIDALNACGSDHFYRQLFSTVS